MKLLAAATVLSVVFSAAAYAEAPMRPQLVVSKDTISIAVGRSQTFRFENPFDGISIATQGAVDASVSTDHEMTLQGIAEGETIVKVFNGGKELYSAKIIVTPEPGSIVRMYGTRKDVPDYVGFYCTDRFCGRADKELDGRREVSSQTTTFIPGGGLSRTKTFGH